MPHAQVDIRINWGDMDALGHVNNAKFYTYMEACRVEFLEKAGVEISSSAQEGPILAESQCRYRLPLQYPDTVTVASWVEAGIRDDGTPCDSSWSEHYILVSHAQNAVVAEGTSKMVNYDYTKARRQPFSRKMRMMILGEGSSNEPAEEREEEAEEVSHDEAIENFQDMMSKYKSGKNSGERPSHVPQRKKGTGGVYSS